MNIQEMHNVFRTIAQQKGMQLIRAILPEEIDIYLNKAIVNKVRNTVVNNTSKVFNDKVTIQNNPISPINSLRTLYRKHEILVNNQPTNEYTFELDIENVMYYTSFTIRYEKDFKSYKGRFIEGDKLVDTLNDYCNRASWDYPIVSIYQDNKDTLNVITNSENKKLAKILIMYIKNPSMVKYDDDINNCINCDLPDYLHEEIIEIAASLFFNSINNTSK